jgi:hypothetical protein
MEYVVGLVIGLAALAALGFVKPQAAHSVLVRRPGERRFSPAAPARESASWQWEYAVMAENAYRDKWSGQLVAPPAAPGPATARAKPRSLLRYRGRVEVAATAHPASFAGEAPLPLDGWFLWPDFPRRTSSGSTLPGPLAQAASSEQLYFEVWQKGDPGTDVAIVFRGTVPKYWQNWVANFRWLFRLSSTSYDLTQSSLAAEFSAQLLVRRSEGSLTRNCTVTAVGHSLGAGLAQQLAYALPTLDSVDGGPIPSPTRVFAFDPTPVTGWAGVANKAQREANALHLDTYRIYERGEVLAYLRLLWSYVVPPSRSAPAITEMRYNFRDLNGQLVGANPISRHSMLLLTLGICTQAGIDLPGVAAPVPARR